MEEVTCGTSQADATSLHETKGKQSTAFEKAYRFMKRELLKSRFLEKSPDSRSLTAICFTQPHRDLKEIRLSAWVLSIVLADLSGINYLWSGDSDTLITEGCVQSALQILAADPGAGGVSALVQIDTRGPSAITRMTQTAFAFDAFLNRASLGSIGRSECLNGPGSIYRIESLRKVLVSWYCTQYPGSYSRTVSRPIHSAVLWSKLT